MGTYRRILAVVEPRADSIHVLRRALQLSRFYGAALAVASVVDYTPNYECDHVPFLTPVEMAQAIARDVGARLESLLVEAGGAGAEVIVAKGAIEEAAAEITASWQPDLVLVGSRAPHGLERNSRGKGGRYDLLIVETAPRGVLGRLVSALQAAI